MKLKNDFCEIAVTVEMHLQEWTPDRGRYDRFYDPDDLVRKEYNTAAEILIENDTGTYSVLLIGDVLSSDADCAILDGKILTVLQNHSVSQIDVTDLSLVRHRRLDGCGQKFSIYNTFKGYLIYGEMEIIMLDRELNIIWDFSGADIFASATGKTAFQMCENTIKLYDFEDNYYEIDYDGKVVFEEQKSR